MNTERELKIAEAVMKAVDAAYPDDVDRLPLSLPAILAAIPPEPVSVPDGWRLVPVEPTESMRQAGAQYAECGISANAVYGYRAMLGAAPKVELTAQEERRVCISDECGWIGPLSETVHPKHDASMILCPECHEVTELAQPAQTLAGDPIRKLIGIHTEYLDANPYCYFELAYTRRTDWMAWICSKPHADDPDRVVLACGQGSTPEEACARAIAAKLKGGL